MTKRRILVVDDEAGIAEIIRANMPVEEYEVEGAANGTEGLQHMHRGKPDLAILDIMMPDLDGFQLLRALGRDAELADIPVIMLTVKADDSNAIRCLEAGAVEYITKPFDPLDLSRIVRLLVEHCDQRLRQAYRHNRLLLIKCLGKSLGELFCTL